MNSSATGRHSSSTNTFDELTFQYLRLTFALLLLCSVMLAVVPRAKFESNRLARCVDLLTSVWPKLDLDRLTLIKKNPEFASKFIISYFVLSCLALFLILAFMIHFFIWAYRDSSELKRSKPSAKVIGAAVLSLLFLTWWIVFLPTPFVDSVGFSTRYPSWELGLIYHVIFLCCMWGSISRLIIEGGLSIVNWRNGDEVGLPKE